MRARARDRARVQSRGAAWGRVGPRWAISLFMLARRGGVGGHFVHLHHPDHLQRRQWLQHRPGVHQLRLRQDG